MPTGDRTHHCVMSGEQPLPAPGPINRTAAIHRSTNSGCNTDAPRVNTHSRRHPNARRANTDTRCNPNTPRTNTHPRRDPNARRTHTDTTGHARTGGAHPDTGIDCEGRQRKQQ